MKKLIKICLMMTLISIRLQSQFTGNLNYRDSYIDADFEVGISDYKSPNTIFYQFVIYKIKINSLKVGNRELSESDIPFAVLSKLKREMRIGSINMDLYVSNSFLKKIDTNSAVYWAELQRLDSAENSKPAVRDQGHKLFDSGAVTIKNPVINTVNYMLDIDYRKSIEQPKADNKNTANASNNSGEVKELGLKMPGLVVSSSEGSSNKSSSDSKSNSDVESSSSSSSSSSDVSNYTPNYTKQEITNQVVAGVAGLAVELINEWNANYDRKRERERTEYEERIGAEIKKEIDEYRDIFTKYYLPLFEREQLSQDQRIKLILGSDLYFSESAFPKREEWLQESVKIDNIDALLYTAYRIHNTTCTKENYFENDIEKAYLEKAASLGSNDAMVILATHLFHNKMANEERILNLLNKAADQGSPNAMYYLGIIYRYGSLDYLSKKPKKFNIKLDENRAVEWFLKAYNAEYEVSLFTRYLIRKKHITLRLWQYYIINDDNAPTNNFLKSIDMDYYSFLGDRYIDLDPEIDKIIYKNIKKKKVNPGYEDVAKQFEEMRGRRSKNEDNHKFTAN